MADRNSEQALTKRAPNTNVKKKVTPVRRRLDAWFRANELLRMAFTVGFIACLVCTVALLRTTPALCRADWISRTTSQVIFFRDKRALDEFESGHLQFDADASVVAITAGASAGVRTTGAAAGASGAYIERSASRRTQA